MNEITEETRRLRQAIVDNKEALGEVFAEYEVVNPRVFGSVAQGNAKEGSDVDILVDGYRPGLGLLRVAEMIHKLEMILGAPVDLVEARLVKKNRQSQIMNGVLLPI